ncbi:hypothetical protein AAVH_16897 [Aphelenchoides avenae]|nr:hypothetical protein AAVH_16897 [Aphelenchus avenae]
MRLRAVEMVRSAKDAMSLLDNLTDKADIYKPCTASYPAWTTEVQAIGISVVGNATRSINASTWQAREPVHELVANGIVTKLNGSTYSDGYYFKALAYLPYADDGQHGFLSLPVGAEDVLRNESKLVKYVVSRYRKRAVHSLDLPRANWVALQKKGNEILDATFSTSTSNLSKRVEEVENRFMKDIDGPFLSAGGFRALVALRCGYEFVWYELGYRYFPAGFTTDAYVLTTKQDNKYKYNCGQIVFFP